MKSDETLDALLAEISSMDPVYVDGAILEGVSNLGNNIMLPFFRWHPERANNGMLQMRRTPVLMLVAPRNTLLPHAPIISALEQQPAPLLDSSGLAYRQ
jgi:hypothetical protein